jgi:RNA polymerase sigma factor (sigma-70 family)
MFSLIRILLTNLAFNTTRVIAGCIANDRKCQELLYQHFFHPMLSLCFRYTRNQEDATEVFHEGLLKVYQHIQHFDASRSALFTWIHTIMVRTAIDFIRKKNGQPVKVEWTDRMEDDIPAEMIADRSADDILFYLKQLDEITATVFNLHVIEGFKHREIAQMLQISEGTSKWHLSEAKKQLSQIIDKRARA